MTITEITAINKSRYKVTLDGETHFVLYRGELLRFQMKQGGELSEKDYESIFCEILPKRAKLRCMNLLKTKDYTRRQLEDKLKQGGYPAEIIEEAIAYVESYGYVDDENYVRNFVEYHMQTRSRRRIENDLLQKGIHRELISKVFDELSEAGLEMDEAAMIQKFLQKKIFTQEQLPIKNGRKCTVFFTEKDFERMQSAEHFYLT